MKKKRYLIPLLAALTVIIPTIWGYHAGVQRAARFIQEHPERHADFERLRVDMAVHFATGGFVVGFFIVVYMVVSQAFIKCFGFVFNGLCSGVGFLWRKMREGTEHQRARYCRWRGKT
jgi:hypothetical protein